MSSCFSPTSDDAVTSATAVVGWSFEVTGHVQGVFFRKYTIQHASQLGLSGWVRNTDRGTVEGAFAGPAGSKALNDMRHWLLHEGSPRSRIDGTTFAALTPDQVEALVQTQSFVKRPTTSS